MSHQIIHKIDGPPTDYTDSPKLWLIKWHAWATGRVCI